MSHARGLMLFLGVGLLVLGLLQATRDVSTADGARCGSAWTSWQREAVDGGDRTPGGQARAADACEAAGEAALRRGAYAGGAGLVLLLGLALVPRRSSPPTLATPGGGGR